MVGPPASSSSPPCPRAVDEVGGASCEELGTRLEVEPLRPSVCLESYSWAGAPLAAPQLMKGYAGSESPPQSSRPELLSLLGPVSPPGLPGPVFFPDLPSPLGRAACAILFVVSGSSCVFLSGPAGPDFKGPPFHFGSGSKSSSRAEVFSLWAPGPGLEPVGYEIKI